MCNRVRVNQGIKSKLLTTKSDFHKTPHSRNTVVNSCTTGVSFGVTVSRTPSLKSHRKVKNINVK